MRWIDGKGLALQRVFAPKSCASASSATPAVVALFYKLAKCRSTWILPHASRCAKAPAMVLDSSPAWEHNRVVQR